MATRTFGWIQNPSSTDTLKDILGLFVQGSKFHTYMTEERLPLLASAGLFQTPNLYLEFQKFSERTNLLHIMPLKEKELEVEAEKRQMLWTCPSCGNRTTMPNIYH